MAESKIVPIKDAVMSLNLYCGDRKVGNFCFKIGNNCVTFTTDKIQGHFYDPGFPKECFNGDPVSFFLGERECVNAVMYNENEEEIGHIMFVSKKEDTFLRRVAIFCTQKFPYDLNGIMVGVDHVEKVSKLPFPVELCTEYVLKFLYKGCVVVTMRKSLYTMFSLTFEDDPSLTFLPMNMIPDIYAETIETLFHKKEGCLRVYHKVGDHALESYNGRWRIRDGKTGKRVRLIYKINEKFVTKTITFDDFEVFLERETKREVRNNAKNSF